MDGLYWRFYLLADLKGKTTVLSSIAKAAEDQLKFSKDNDGKGKLHFVDTA